MLYMRPSRVWSLGRPDDGARCYLKSFFFDVNGVLCNICVMAGRVCYCAVFEVPPERDWGIATPHL